MTTDNRLDEIKKRYNDETQAFPAPATCSVDVNYLLDQLAKADAVCETLERRGWAETIGPLIEAWRESREESSEVT